MEYLVELLIVLAPWFIFVVFGFLAKAMIGYAKKRKGAVVAFGVLVQMFLPDPMVEKTIETVVIEKRAIKKQQEESDE